MKFTCANYLGVLRSLFNFTASKYVFIKDWRLGVILRSLQVGILAYVLTDIFLKASYLATEVPTGYVTVWPDGTNSVSKKNEFRSQSEAVANNSLDYCKNPEDYDFRWRGVKHEGFECAYIDPAYLFIDGESQTFLTTSMRVEKTHFYTKDSSGRCMAGRKVGQNAKLFDDIKDACGYMESTGFFPIMPENATFNLAHSYSTSSAIDKKGTLPRTIVRAPNYNGQEVVFESGEQIQVRLVDLLNIAGVDLDKRLNEQDHPGKVDQSQGTRMNGQVEYPYARVSGLTLHVTFNYYTRRLAPGSHKKTAGANADDIVCLVDVVPLNKWSFVGSDIRQLMNSPEDPIFLTPDLLADRSSSIRGEPEFISSQTDIQRNGITIVFSVSGSVGTFNIRALIDALVAGSVLLAVAQVITTYVALYALGLSSELYKAFMREAVDWRTEYARYAAQACVAGYAFLKYDANGSMKLDRKEIFDVLKTLMYKRQNVEDWQLAALTDFIMRHGDKGTKVQRGRFNSNASRHENLIDMEEWIDIFTEEKVNWPALERLIQWEYPDDASRKGVTDLLRQATLRRSKSFAMTGGIREAEDEDEDDAMERDGTPIALAGPVDIEADLHVPLLNQQQAMPSRSVSRRIPRASL